MTHPAPIAQGAPIVTAPRHPLAGVNGFALATISLIAFAGWLLTYGFHAAGDGRAILVSAIVASVVQIAAFPIVKRVAARNLIAGWGVGALVRLGALVAYGLVAGVAVKLPLPAALLSLAVFYFVSMVIEPLFLGS